MIIHSYALLRLRTQSHTQFLTIKSETEFTVRLRTHHHQISSYANSNTFPKPTISDRRLRPICLCSWSTCIIACTQLGKPKPCGHQFDKLHVFFSPMSINIFTFTCASLQVSSLFGTTRQSAFVHRTLALHSSQLSSLAPHGPFRNHE
jgi:hypothetical protein